MTRAGGQDTNTPAPKGPGPSERRGSAHVRVKVEHGIGLEYGGLLACCCAMMTWWQKGVFDCDACQRNEFGRALLAPVVGKWVWMWTCEMHNGHLLIGGAWRATEKNSMDNAIQCYTLWVVDKVVTEADARRSRSRISAPWNFLKFEIRISRQTWLWQWQWHSKKSVQQSLEAWPYRRECSGHNSAKKESVRAGVAFAVGKVCTCTQLNDSVQYTGSRWEKREAEKENTGVAVMNSLKSIHHQ